MAHAGHTQGHHSQASPSNSHASENRASENNDEKLGQIRQQIQLLRADLSKAHEEKADQRKQLEDIERRIGTQARLIHAIDRQITLQQSKLQSLQIKEKQLNKSLQQQQTGLAQQVRAMYSLGQQEFLKLVLNQQNPSTVTRTLTYYDYFNQARTQRIGAVRQRLDSLNRVKRDIQTTTHNLEDTQQDRLQNKQSLEHSRQQRQQLLASLDKRINRQGQHLDQLLRDEQQLLQLIKQLSQQQHTAPDEAIRTKAFAKLKGQLLWPTQGKITARFGSKRSGSDLRWKGIMIKAAQGSDVHAVSYGHVIYADWLRGFGLLMIVDHGNGYMSLYGHNESLYKETGQWVQADEVIASVGASGGYQGNGLYFEIRRHGRPTNPLTWFKKPR